MVPSLIACGSPVKVETSEILMLGEVCRCERVEQGYEVGMVLSETLAGLVDLQQLNRALLQQDAPRLVEVPTRS